MVGGTPTPSPFLELLGLGTYRFFLGYNKGERPILYEFLDETQTTLSMGADV